MGTRDLDWFRRALTNISNDTDSALSYLSEIKIALTSLNSTELKYTANNLNFFIIFDCLNSSDREQIQVSCEILKTLLSMLDAPVVLRIYGVNLLRALKHPNKEVKILALNEMLKAVSDADLSVRLSKEGDILLNIIECVAHEDLSVAKISILFLERFGCTVSNLDVLYSHPLLTALNEVKKLNDIIRFRVYQIVVQVSTASLPGLQASHNCGLLKELIEEIKQSDVLAQLTALEILTGLALTHHGLEYLENYSVTTFLAKQLQNAVNDGVASLLLPGLIKFFGNVAQLRPKEVFDKYPEVIRTVFGALDSPDRSLSGIAMETVGYVATTAEGKLCLQRYGDSMNSVMKKLSDCISFAPTDSRVRALNTVANIIQLEVTDQNSELLGLTEAWFSKLCPEPMLKMMELCRQPFPEIKLAGFLVLQNIAQQEWGQHLINKCPGLLEFLMDRDVESTLQCKTEKHKVVELLVYACTATSVFEESTYHQLQEYVKQGPCYVRTQTEVAIEGAS